MKNFIFSIPVLLWILMCPFDQLYSHESANWLFHPGIETGETNVAADSSYEPPASIYKVGGCLLGIVGGIASGFVIAKLADYPLEEGGVYTPIIVGGGLGGFLGYKIGAAIHHRKDQKRRLLNQETNNLTNRIHIILGTDWVTTKANSDIIDAFRVSGFNGKDQSDRYALNLGIVYSLSTRFNLGFEIAGIPPQKIDAEESALELGYEAGGISYCLLVDYIIFPPKSNAFEFALGTGLTYNSVSTGGSFELIEEYERPVEEIWSMIHKDEKLIGVHLRACLDYYFLNDLSILFKVNGNLMPAIDCPELTYTHYAGIYTKVLKSHSVNLSNVKLSIGLRFRF